MDYAIKHDEGFEISQSSSLNQTPPKRQEYHKKTTMIDAKTHLTGDLNSDGEIIINGKMIGNICAHRVTIGVDAVLIGQILAQDITIFGRCEGRFKAQSVVIGATAYVKGNIEQNSLCLAFGANIDAKIKKMP